MITEVRRTEPGEALLAELKGLKEQGYNVLIDLTAIDWSAVSRGPKGDSSDNLKRAVPAERLNDVHTIASAEGEEYGTPKMPERLSPEQAKFYEPRPERFEVVYRLAKIDPATGVDGGRVEVRAYVPEGEAVLRTAAGLWPIADWLEREIWDMFGVKFADRPDIKRLLLYEQFEGHPLRKDYPITKRQPLIGPANADLPDRPTFNLIKPTVKFE